MRYVRLKKNTQFQKLFKRGKRAFSSSVTMIYLPSERMQMGVALSKKHGKAVKRNRLKRQLRAAFDKNCALLDANYCVIIMPRPSEEYDYKTLEKSLISCFKKINRCEK